MNRYREYDVRSVTDLSGVWDFAFLGDRDPDAVDVASIQFTDRMAVPGCFDATPTYAGRRGLAAYRTYALLRDDVPHRLVFNGVHHWCRVFVDGTRLRDHVGGFTRFAADVPGDAGERRSAEVAVVVLVDNRFDYDRCPLHLDYFDWYHFGGIARPVELHRLGEAWIDALRVVTEEVATPKVGVTIDYGAAAPAGRAALTITCDGREVLSEAVDLKGPAGHIRRTLELPGATLWSPGSPNLHSLHVRLGEDDVRQRVGIRRVSVDGRRVLINGESVRLLGVCRHEAHPQFGHGLPESLLVADVQQLRDMGCNFVRGSHYPQDPRFLDLCDEAGLCVWNEAIGWQHGSNHLTDPHFVRAQLAHIDEMVAVSFNHPSVIMWGILNESHSHDAACRPTYETLLGRLRELDPSRPVTYACNHPFDDVCLDLADVVSINCYPGWYVGEIADIPAELDRIVAHLDSTGQAGKPLIISEIGAGAVPGWRDWNEDRWTEQYQAKLLDAVIRHLFVEQDRACGLSIWQFCDCRTSELGWKALGRPRGFNNKGILDEYRRPKLAYEVVKRHFRALSGSALP
jgi:beta-glucuronidase